MRSGRFQDRDPVVGDSPLDDRALRPSSLQPLRLAWASLVDAAERMLAARASSERRTRNVAIAVVILSLGVAAMLGIAYRDLGGPGDQLLYFAQAERLLPFVDHYYGPAYFIALRAVHTVLPVDWFSAGKALAFVGFASFLVLCGIFFGRVLGKHERWLALMLVAVNPAVVAAGFQITNDIFAACWLIAAIWLTLRTPVAASTGWLLSGFLFGVAYLTRFAALGYLLGALVGALMLEARVKDRLRVGALVAAGAAAPALSWILLLELVQGYVPANHNFVHLTMAFGEFREFWELDAVIQKYGSLWGVLSSDPAAPLLIAKSAAEEAIKFPFTVGPHLFFVLAGLLIPGLIILLARRSSYAPWFGAFVAGLILTGISSRGWLRYYIPAVPFCAILIVVALSNLSAAFNATAQRVMAACLVLLMLPWSAVSIASAFATENWTEMGVARRYLQRRSDSTTVVSSTAASLPYGTNLRFVDHDSIHPPGDSVGLLDRLHRHGVTHLVITERHTLFAFPELASLLEDVPRNVPAGLQRDTLITTPRRLAIYRVLRDGGDTGR
jgi:hypothetical protein